MNNNDNISPVSYELCDDESQTIENVLKEFIGYYVKSHLQRACHPQIYAIVERVKDLKEGKWYLTDPGDFSCDYIGYFIKYNRLYMSFIDEKNGAFTSLTGSFVFELGKEYPEYDWNEQVKSTYIISSETNLKELFYYHFKPSYRLNEKGKFVNPPVGDWFLPKCEACTDLFNIYRLSISPYKFIL